MSSKVADLVNNHYSILSVRVFQLFPLKKCYRISFWREHRVDIQELKSFALMIGCLIVERASGEFERDSTDIDPCRLLACTARVVVCPQKRNAACEGVEIDWTSKWKAQKRLRILRYRRTSSEISCFPQVLCYCHWLLSKCHVAYRIASFVGGCFHFQSAEADVRYGRGAHSCCYVIVPVVKPMQLEMRSL